MEAIERLYEYIKYKGIVISKFETENGLSNGYLSKMLARKSSIGSTIVKRIHYNCPDMSVLWLITGDGEMTNNPSFEELADQKKSDLYSEDMKTLDLIKEKEAIYETKDEFIDGLKLIIAEQKNIIEYYKNLLEKMK